MTLRDLGVGILSYFLIHMNNPMTLRFLLRKDAYIEKPRGLRVLMVEQFFIYRKRVGAEMLWLMVF